jgi:hypothetical protein
VNAGQPLDDEDTKRLRAAETFFDSVGVPSGLTEETLGPAQFRFCLRSWRDGGLFTLTALRPFEGRECGQAFDEKDNKRLRAAETFLDSVGVPSGLKEMNPEPFSIL